MNPAQGRDGTDQNTTTFKDSGVSMATTRAGCTGGAFSAVLYDMRGTYSPRTGGEQQGEKATARGGPSFNLFIHTDDQ